MERAFLLICVSEHKLFLIIQNCPREFKRELKTNALFFVKLPNTNANTNEREHVFFKLANTNEHEHAFCVKC